MFTKTLLLISLLLMLYSCNIYKAPLEEDIKSKQLICPEGKSLVYIMRPSNFGFAIKFKINCDSNYIGSTKGKTFIYTIINPGIHTFSSKSENISKLDLKVEENKIYYIELKPKLGFFMARNKLTYLSNNEKNTLNKCNLSKDCKANTK